MLNYSRPWMIVLVSALAYIGVILALNDGDPYTFVTLGDCFRQCEGAGDLACQGGAEGYDGQFAYYIAREPLAAADCLDVPAYRYQRMLLPALAWAFSAGGTLPLPWILIGINLVVLVGSTALLEDLLGAERASRWYAMSYGLFPGIFMAVCLSTTEALAFGLVVAAVWSYQRARLWWAFVFLALAGLAKETTGVFAAGFLLHFALHRRWRDALRVTIVVGVPFVVWQIALYAWLGEIGVSSGGAKSTAFETVPYLGIIRIWAEGSAAALPSAWALWRTGRYLAWRRWHLYACLLFANALIFPFIPFSTYREPLGLLRFMPGLVLALILYAAHERLRRPLLYSTLWIVLLMFVVAG